MSLKITPLGINNTGLIIAPLGFEGDGVVDSADVGGGIATENLYLGSTQPTSIYIGSTQVTAVYKGSTLIWGS